MSDNAATYISKVRRAVKILFYKRHRQPGVKGWELQRALGKDYLKIVVLLNHQLENLDLQVKIVYEASDSLKNPTPEQIEKARFYITLKEPLSTSDMSMAGWRVDDVAILVVAIAFIISKQGKAPRKDVEEILHEKFRKLQIDYSLNRFIRMGYLAQDEANVMYLDWRTRAEIDQKMLLKLILGEEISKKIKTSSP